MSPAASATASRRRTQSGAASSTWTGRPEAPGERSRPWNRLFYDATFDELARSTDLRSPIDEVWTPIMSRVVLGGDMASGDADDTDDIGGEA